VCDAAIAAEATPVVYTGVGLSVQGMPAGLSADASMTITFAFDGAAAQISFVPPALVAGLKTTIAANGLCRVSSGTVFCGAAQAAGGDEIFVPLRADGGDGLKGGSGGPPACPPGTGARPAAHRRCRCSQRQPTGARPSAVRLALARPLAHVLVRACRMRGR
jgi:hypothetical protein